jgi:hypothetical protein
MTTLSANPFVITKATDLSDEGISLTWVDIPGEGGFQKFVDPRSPMPQRLLGGKGSGRTHLMRYYSFALQALRAQQKRIPLPQQLKEDGYVGVFFRCEGLNAGRFHGRQLADATWLDVFTYYMDLTLAQVTLGAIELAWSSQKPSWETAFCDKLAALFDGPVPSVVRSVHEAIEMLQQLSRDIDLRVNNASLTGSIDGIRVLVTRGRLVFGIPQALAAVVPELSRVQFLYLLDELENLTAEQQRYVNTLVRERQAPTSIKLGARLYGARTTRTLSADEENREGSEFETVRLDDQLRTSGRYDTFARSLVARRVLEAGYPALGEDRDSSTAALARALDMHFDNYRDTRLYTDATNFLANTPSTERRHFEVLRRQLQDLFRRSDSPSLGNTDDLERILSLLEVRDYPLLEKANVFMLYQGWFARRRLVDEAERISASCRAYLNQQAEGDWHDRVLGHFKLDLLAQLLRDGRKPPHYNGLESFVAMSDGLPRSLLIILKFVFKWATFFGEDPFGTAPISMKAQLAGVTQASNWFFEDARAPGADSNVVHRGIDRLARFFAALRFSDKPVESSLITFACNYTMLSDSARETITRAVDISLLIQVASGHKEKNEDAVLDKYQLNAMLCPRYSLPTGRRGTIELRREEAEAIFDEHQSAVFDAVLKGRLMRMNVPFRAHDTGDAPAADESQRTLPGLL